MDDFMAKMSTFSSLFLFLYGKKDLILLLEYKLQN